MRHAWLAFVVVEHDTWHRVLARVALVEAAP